MQPVPLRVAGELYIGGVQVARGYLARPELTAKAFVPNPFDKGRLYKTGDLARYREDEAIEFLGRIDQQVKLRGQRIGLGEIEVMLKSHGAARDCVVVVREKEGKPTSGWWRTWWLTALARRSFGSMPSRGCRTIWCPRRWCSSRSYP
jgi:acyl-coenzyme A synthetase/AMP-(fatty) acid ligase